MARKPTATPKGLAKRRVPTKTDYERYLDECAPSYGSDEWIIGGKLREALMSRGRYGRAVREYDKVAFICGYTEFTRGYGG